MDMDIDILVNNYPILVDRALINRYEIGCEYDTVYVDYDDTLIVRGSVNGLLVMYLYQLVEKGKDVILLTRHDGDVLANLREHRIEPRLFTRIIHLQRDEQKCRYIIQSKAIFIDNAYAERKQVATELGIPVFDVDAVWSLLDWRL